MVIDSLGTTSAYAENTHLRNDRAQGGRNYLRVRGEYVDALAASEYVLELPPRTRRIHGRVLMEKPKNGTTSAYAENTDTLLGHKEYSGNYLRVRGEYTHHI